MSYSSRVKAVILIIVIGVACVFGYVTYAYGSCSCCPVVSTVNYGVYQGMLKEVVTKKIISELKRIAWNKLNEEFKPGYIATRMYNYYKKSGGTGLIASTKGNIGYSEVPAYLNKYDEIVRVHYNTYSAREIPYVESVEQAFIDTLNNEIITDARKTLKAIIVSKLDNYDYSYSAEDIEPCVDEAIEPLQGILVSKRVVDSYHAVPETKKNLDYLGQYLTSLRISVQLAEQLDSKVQYHGMLEHSRAVSQERVPSCSVTDRVFENRAREIFVKMDKDVKIFQKIFNEAMRESSYSSSNTQFDAIVKAEMMKIYPGLRLCSNLCRDNYLISYFSAEPCGISLNKDEVLQVASVIPRARQRAVRKVLTNVNQHMKKELQAYYNRAQQDVCAQLKKDVKYSIKKSKVVKMANPSIEDKKNKKNKIVNYRDICKDGVTDLVYMKDSKLSYKDRQKLYEDIITECRNVSELSAVDKARLKEVRLAIDALKYADKLQAQLDQIFPGGFDKESSKQATKDVAILWYWWVSTQNEINKLYGNQVPDFYNTSLMYGNQ